MSKIDLSFEDLEVIQGNKRVVWEWIGEGKSGDYEEADADDLPLLRFSCYTDKDANSEVYGEWNPIPDSSYCTRMPINSLKRHLLISAGIILEALENPNYKRELEHLSWLCPADFDKENSSYKAQAKELTLEYDRLTDILDQNGIEY